MKLGLHIANWDLNDPTDSTSVMLFLQLTFFSPHSQGNESMICTKRDSLFYGCFGPLLNISVGLEVRMFSALLIGYLDVNSKCFL